MLYRVDIMEYRTQDNFDHPLAAAKKAVCEDALLESSVIDLQVYDDCLVAFIDNQLPSAFVTSILKGVWPGSVEAYCLGGLMAGSSQSL